MPSFQRAQDLVVSGTVEHSVVTMGHEGALLVSADGIKRLRAPEVEVKSAVGAGDSFVGAMTLGLALGRPLDEAFALELRRGQRRLPRSARNSVSGRSSRRSTRP